jgi:hypothetical protein
MADEAEPKQASPESEGKAASARAGQELIDELTALGQKFAEVVEVAWNSDERRRLEDDLRRGLASVADSLETGLKKVSETKETKDLLAKAEGVATKVRTSKVTNDLADALASGLRQLSESLDKWADEMRSRSEKSEKSEESGGSDDTTQDISIERE